MQTLLRLAVIALPVLCLAAGPSPATGQPGTELTVLPTPTHESNWIFGLATGLIGGLGMFLFGIRIMSEGLRSTAAGRIRSVLSTLTHNRAVAVGAGAFVTILVQSSSATTVMLVSFVRAGLMTFAQTVGMILGADVGTTVTAQLIAFDLGDYALLMIGVGMALMLQQKREKLRDVGETIFGFGLLFFGMVVMSDAMEPLKTHEAFIGRLVTLENPALGIAVGMVFTALIQSSGAFTGILIVLASQGLLTLEAGIPLLFGANIGTCVTAFLAGIGTNREAQRVALAHVLFKAVGVALFVWWIPGFADLIRWISPAGPSAGDPSGVLPRQIANAHTVFNVGLAAVMLPFTGVATTLITRLLPDKPSVVAAGRIRFLDNALLKTPALALNLAKTEVLHMSSIVRSMTERIIDPFTEHDGDGIARLESDENRVDDINDAVQGYLAAISRQSLSEDRINEVFQMMYTVTELEQIGDIITKNLVPRARAWLDSDLRFSGEGREELLDFHKKTVKQLSRAIEVFEDVNLEAESKVRQKHDRYRKIEDEYLRSHFERIRRHIPETLESSEYHQELMEQFRRITSHSTRIARIQLSWSEEPPERNGGQ